MRVVCPYVEGMLNQETDDALHAHARGITEWRLLPKDDPFAYGELLAELWERADDFLLVEQDIKIRQDVVDAFITCSCNYGGFPYPWLTDVGIALGCTWFRSQIMRAYPNAVKEALAKGPTWKQLDVVFQRHVLVREYGLQPHVHFPPVEHLNPLKGKLMEGASPDPLLKLPAF